MECAQQQVEEEEVVPRHSFPLQLNTIHPQGHFPLSRVVFLNYINLGLEKQPSALA